MALLLDDQNSVRTNKSSVVVSHEAQTAARCARVRRSRGSARRCAHLARIC